MPLNSWQFLVLAVSAAVLLPTTTGVVRAVLFLLMNAVFAGSYWGLSMAPIAVAYCLTGYACARLVAGRPKGALIVAVTVLTVIFAYLRGYSLHTLTTTDAVGGDSVLAFAGLSFLFFKMTHVVIDSAGGAIESLSFWRYLAYCTNFTTLLMGPIQRYQDFISQWASPTFGQAGFEQKLDAVNRVLRGLLKAFALAPWLQPYVLGPGLAIESLGAGALLLRAYAFYVFLYLDFSGYCDIVIGVGAIMGIRPPENFHFPFAARNVSSYWLRVHRSLTLWLTDYVFTPTYRALLSSERLGRHGFLALSAALMLTMLVAGVWHGTTLNFVAFGLIHGVALVIVRGYEQVMVRWLGRSSFRAFSDSWPVTAVAVFLTYNFTSLAYAFFVLDLDESLRLFDRLAAIAIAGVTA